ncbi:MAG: hypothetical protein HQ472_00600 [Ignavibacteria bacterium]|nr:hypothetical protein [Ignavibacteria bacterium]
MIRWIVLCLVVTYFSSVGAVAQSVTDQQGVPFFKMTGSMSTTADYYGVNSSRDSAGNPLWKARQPGSMYRFVIAPTFSFFDAFVIPVYASFTLTETNTITPSISSPTITDFLQNPLNTISITVKPGVDWATVQLGMHVPQYSELAGSQSQIFGYGARVTPLIFRAAFNRGIFQRAAPSDTVKGIGGAWQRNLTFFSVGFGKQDSTYVDLNVVRMTEDSTSLAPGRRPLSRQISRSVETPELPAQPIYRETVVWAPKAISEGLLLSINTKVSFEEGLYLFAEGAASFQTNDVKSPGLDIGISLPSYILTPRESTHGDVAALAGLGFKAEDWGLIGKVKYVGPGFTSFATPFQQFDFLDFTVSPRLQLFNYHFFFDGTLGYRISNLSNKVGESLSQQIASLNATIIPIDELTISLGFNNFQLRNSVVNDTMRIQNVSRSIYMSTTAMIPKGKAMHTISTTFSLDRYQDLNVISSALTDNDTYSVYGQYSWMLGTIPLTLNTNANYLTNTAPNFGFTQVSGGIGGSYLMFDNDVTPSASLQYSITTQAEGSKDHQIVTRFGLRWSMMKSLSMSADASLNVYRYGAWRNNGSFTESFLRISLTQSL